ncbi:cold-shock protein [Streptomyces nigra]|uniref:cold-shock protein n=1 Tax=Streptomyces nigra TaxID=1827580 RepID=UPI0037D97DA7
MARGKVLNFDEFRGYGFISSDAADEDVFVHANDLLDEKSLFRSGVVVEFDIENGDRGLKASNVKIARSSFQGPRDPAVVQGIGQAGSAGEDDPLCDVLSAVELRAEVTEAVLRTVPEMTAAQILLVRECVLDIAHSHNWIER